MRHCTIFLILFYSQILSAQFVQEKSIEFNIQGSEEQFGVVPAEKHGVFLFNEVLNLNVVSERKWQVHFLDTLLVPIWTSYFESAYNFRITHIRYYRGYVYLLFEDTNIPTKSIFFARSGFEKDSFELFELKEFLPKEIVGFEAMGNSLFLIGSDSGRPSILKFRFGDPRPLAFKGLYSDNNDLLHTSLVPSQNLIQIITKMKSRQGKNKVLLIKQFDENGVIHKDIIIDSNRGYNLLDCVASTNDNGDIYVVGTYNDGGSRLSQGVFTMVADREAEHQVYYYSYLNLHNFFKHLTADEKDKIERKNKSKGGVSRKQNYRINQVPRELRKSDDGWIFCGEIVEVDERNTITYGNLWSSKYWLYSHAVFLGIGKDGKLKWDNSMEMNGLATESNMQRIFVSDYQNHHVVYYVDNGNIRYQEIDEGKDVGLINEMSMESSLLEIAENKSSGNDNILPWYKNAFLNYGTFPIEWGQGKERKLFYLNKVLIKEQ